MIDPDEDLGVRRIDDRAVLAFDQQERHRLAVVDREVGLLAADRADSLDHLEQVRDARQPRQRRLERAALERADFAGDPAMHALAQLADRRG